MDTVVHCASSSGERVEVGAEGEPLTRPARTDGDSEEVITDARVAPRGRTSVTGDLRIIILCGALGQRRSPCTGEGRRGPCRPGRQRGERPVCRFVVRSGSSSVSIVPSSVSPAAVARSLMRPLLRFQSSRRLRNAGGSCCRTWSARTRWPCACPGTCRCRGVRRTGRPFRRPRGRGT